MNYYLFNRQESLKNAKEKYVNKGGKKKLQSIIKTIKKL